MKLTDVKTQADYIEWQAQEIERLHQRELDLTHQIQKLFSMLVTKEKAENETN